MRIRTLFLEHFRNYGRETVAFTDHDVQLIVGKNGSGKTNLLEAISVLSLGKSCRGKDDHDMIQWEAGHYRIKADAVSDAGEPSAIESVCELHPRRKKAAFVNDVRATQTSFIGLLPTVTFLPQDLELFSGAPAERRRFLDQLLSQLSPAYFADLVSFQKVLQQRNALLKRIAAGQEREEALDIWDGEIASRGSRITVARLELLETLNLSYVSELSGLQEPWKDAQLRYERKTTGRHEETLKEETVRLLRETRPRDIMIQTTSVGPHREDWQVYRDGRALPSFASRGQERVAVLALLLLEVSYLELRRGEKPVVLLDDVFSELDTEHQTALLERFRGSQVFMTSTRIPDRADDASVFIVEGGNVSAGARD